MSHISNLVKRTISSDNRKPLKVGNYTASERNGIYSFVIDYQYKGNHFATLRIDRDLIVQGTTNPCEPKATIELYRNIPKGSVFCLAVKKEYPHVAIKKAL